MSAEGAVRRAFNPDSHFAGHAVFGEPILCGYGLDQAIAAPRQAFGHPRDNEGDPVSQQFGFSAGRCLGAGGGGIALWQLARFEARKCQPRPHQPCQGRQCQRHRPARVFQAQALARVGHRG